MGVEGGKTGGNPAGIWSQGEGGQGRQEAGSFDCFIDAVLNTPEGTGNARGKTVELQVEESLWQLQWGVSWKAGLEVVTMCSRVRDGGEDPEDLRSFQRDLGGRSRAI